MIQNVNNKIYAVILEDMMMTSSTFIIVVTKIEAPKEKNNVSNNILSTYNLMLKILTIKIFHY